MDAFDHKLKHNKALQTNNLHEYKNPKQQRRDKSLKKFYRGVSYREIELNQCPRTNARCHFTNCLKRMEILINSYEGNKENLL